jgi:acyl-CoA thioester hydrolase
MDEVGRLLAKFPVVIEIPVAWGEMDSMGHVNNIIYFRYFESARMVYLKRIGFLEETARTGVGPILASTRCDFRKPLVFPDQVSVGIRVDDIEADRFVTYYRLVSHKLSKVAAEGEGSVVCYDYENGKKANLPESIRNAIASLEGEVEG